MIDDDGLRAEFDATEPAGKAKKTLVEYVREPNVAAEIWRARWRGLNWDQITAIVNRKLDASYAPTTVATTMSRYAPRRKTAKQSISAPPRRPVVSRSSSEERRGREDRSDAPRAPGTARSASVPQTTSDHEIPSAGDTPAETDLQRESVGSVSSSWTPTGARPVRRIK